MEIDEKFLKEFVKVTQQASIATLPKIGKNDKNEVDKLATDAMRKVLNNIEMKGRVVIGEGEIDQAPMLYIGEILGNNDCPELDIAVDPLEGTNFAANNLPGALSVIAASYKDNLLNVFFLISSSEIQSVFGSTSINLGNAPNIFSELGVATMV